MQLKLAEQDSIKIVVNGGRGPRGLTGPSAYDLAVANGFVGNLDAWLNSLQGESEPGIPGLSAYQVATNNGFSGSEVEWLAYLHGADSTVPGDPGPAGKLLIALNRAALASLTTELGDTVYLAEGRRKGFFTFDTSNLSTQVAADPQQGLYVAPAANPDGSLGAWVRNWNSIVGYPEWFGAIGNNAAIDNRTALLACYTLCPIMQLASLDYYIAGKISFNLGYRAVLGPFNPDGYDSGHGCRLISTLTSQDVARVGPSVVPANTDQFLRNIVIKNICFMFVGARTIPAAGLAKEAVANLRVEYVIDSTISDNYANEPLVGFAYLGVIGSVLERNRVFRSALFGADDFVIGHLLTGLALSAFGLVGNNASYFGKNWNCTLAGDAKSTLPTGDRIGMWFDGAITDGFNFEPETLGCGIRITGLGAADISASNGDFYIDHPIMDQYDGISLEISGISKTGHVRISEPYAGAPHVTEYIIRIRDSGGAVTLKGGDLYGTAGTNNTIGINVENSTGTVIVEDVVIHECGRPTTIINSDNVIMNPRVVNWLNVSAGPQAPVAIVNSQRLMVRPIVVGAAGSYPQGIMTYDALCSGVFDVSGIDTSVIVAGVANLMIVNGKSLNAPGYYSVDGDPSVLASGIELRGLLTTSIPAIMKPKVVVDAASITLNGHTGINFNITFGALAARVLENPTNMSPGQSGRIRIQQDAVGGRTMTYGTSWKFAGGDPTLSTAANAIDIVAYYVNAADDIEATFVGPLS